MILKVFKELRHIILKKFITTILLLLLLIDVNNFLGVYINKRY